MPYADPTTERAYQKDYQPRWHAENRQYVLDRQRAYRLRRSASQRFADNSNRRARGYGLAGRLRGTEVALVVGPCVYCGATQETWDHRTPLGRGGANAVENLAPACNHCNRTKRLRTAEEWAR